MEYDLRPAVEADKEWAYELSVRCYRDVVVRPIGSWDDAAPRAHFETKWDPSTYTVVTCGGRPAGVICLRREEDHFWLSEIQVDPEFQNRGIGGRLLRELVARAEREGVPLRLHVLRENRARALYARLGFVRTGETESHVLMEWGPVSTKERDDE